MSDRATYAILVSFGLCLLGASVLISMIIEPICTDATCRIDGKVVFSGECNYVRIREDRLDIKARGETMTWVYGDRSVDCVERDCER